MSDAETPAQPATHVRFRVIFACMMMAILLYLDRFCISFAEVFIKDELGLSDQQIAIILGSFFVSYALCQVPSGWLSDRFGARKMLTIYILLWSLFTALTGFVSGFVMLLVLRLGFGVGQAGAYPTSANIVSKWVPLSARGFASSLVAVGGRLGGALAPILTAFLIVLFVPISQSSELTPGDLMQPHQFAVKFTENLDNKQEFETKIYSHLSPESKSYLKTTASDSETEKGTAVEANFLVNLNSILEKDTLYDPADFEDLKLNQQAEQLLNVKPGEIDVEQRSRLNRLLFEARYYTEVRKVQGQGWRPVMMVYGVFGIVIAGFFWWSIRDYPRKHPGCSKKELEIIEYGRLEADKDHSTDIGGIPLKALVKNRSLWMLSLSQFCTNIGWLFLVTWLPRYLDETYQVPLKMRGTMITVALAVGWFGTLSGGRATDWLMQRISLRWSRVLPIVVSRFTAMGAYIALCLFDVSPWGAIALFSVVAFSTDFGSPAMWAFNQDIGGKHVGSVLGWGNMWGNLGAAIAPLLMITVIGKDDHNWNIAFITCAIAFFIAGLASLCVNTSQTLFVADEDQSELETA
ncbi:MAG: MFS transporter [Gimesia sp.]